MPSPPKAHYCFTIPSIRDDTTLNCRIYHPDFLGASQTQNDDTGKQWRRKGILMAHPYAPMGGSYDDRVVGIVVEEFLALDFVVGTFNFRGAHGAKGRTSWSGKPEVDDYHSFAAFFMHYMSYIHPHPAPEATFTPDQSPISPSQPQPQPTVASVPSNESPLVILGGYSYGSLILKHLPPTPSILQPFSAPISGCAASEIVLRARKLSDQSNLEWINIARDRERQKRRGHGNKLSVTMGGEETSPEKRRKSTEIRRSIDGRRSLDFGERIRSLGHRRRNDSSPRTPPNGGDVSVIEVPEVRYLLISPLMPPISTLVAPGLAPKFWNRAQGQQEVIGKHTALVVYGDEDIFTSSKKVQQWTQKLSSDSGSQFSHVEVAGAGHFWHEHGVEGKLRASLKDWAPGE